MTLSRKILFVLISTLLSQVSMAQIDPTALDRSALLGLYGGMSRPNNELPDDFGQLLHANNGGNFGVECNYIISYGIGLGLDIGVDWNAMDEEAFLAESNAESYIIKRRYSSNYGGLNLSYNLPIIVTDGFWINIYGMGTAGLRGMRIPDIDLYYNELANKNVEVSYRPRTSTMGYLSASGGLNLIFNEKWGIYANYKRVLRSQHRINYSVRMFDAQENLTEDENFMSAYLASDSFRFGLFLRLGN